MGYILNEWQEEQRRRKELDPSNPKNQDPYSTVKTANPSGYSGSVNPITGAVQQSSAATPAAESQGYVNLSDYLNANRGKGEAMAGSLAGGVTSAGKGVEDNFAALQNQYAQQVQAGTVQPFSNGPLRTPTRSSGPIMNSTAPAAPAATPRTGYGVTQPAPAPVTAPVPTQTYGTAGRGYTATVPVDPTLAAAQTTAGQTYTGPGSVSEIPGYGDVASGARDVEARAKNLGTFGGVQAELQNSATGPYSQGGSLLDAYLASAAGGQQLQDAGKRYGDLATRVGTQGTDTSRADTARTLSEAQAGRAQDYVTRRTTEQESAARAAQSDADQIDVQYAQARRGLVAGGPSRDEFARMTPEARAFYAQYGFNPTTPYPKNPYGG